MSVNCTGCRYSLCDFLELINNKNDLTVFLKQHGVIDFGGSLICPKCNNSCKYYEDRNIFVCNTTAMVAKSHKKRVRQRCGFSQTPKKNTFFYGSKKSVEEICRFVAIWLTWNPVQETLQREINWSTKTVVDWTSFCREVCLINIIENSELLGGEGKTVEMVEAEFDSRKSVRGSLISGNWILIGVEIGSKNIFMVPVVERNQDTLLQIVNDRILPGTTIISKCWKSYDCLNHEQFQQQILNHNKNFVDPESVSHDLKDVCRDICKNTTRNRQRKENYIYYLAESYFRLRYRKHTGRIHEFFKYIGEVHPPTVSSSMENEIVE